MNELALFAGAGGGILGGKLLGWRTVCAVEFDPYAAAVLCARQNDGLLAPFPIWDDVRTFDGKPWRGIVDVVSGGFPCQDISTAGKGAGITGERSGLWREMARIIGEVRPRFAFVENSPALTRRGLDVVLGDLAALGYDASWGVLGAVDAGAPHKRDRIWILAYADLHEHRANGKSQDKASAVSRNSRQARRPGRTSGTSRNTEILADANAQGLQGRKHRASSDAQGWQEPNGSTAKRGGVCADATDVGDALRRGQSRPRKSWYACDPAENREGETDQSFHERVGYIWGLESRLGRVAHGVAARVDRLKAIGNGQVPAVAALAWEILKPQDATLQS